MIFFTADTHFSHTRIIQYCHRPFDTIEKMNEVLINNWNRAVQPSDIVYHIGDFGLGSQDQLSNIFRRLNGTKILVAGCHDKNSLTLPWQNVFSFLILSEKKSGLSKPVTLCHYSMRVWYASHYNAYHLFGHSHGHLVPFGKSFDVGVDAQNHTPISSEDVKKIMSELSDNFNLIKEKNKT